MDGALLYVIVLLTTSPTLHISVLKLCHLHSVRIITYWIKLLISKVHNIWHLAHILLLSKNITTALILRRPLLNVCSPWTQDDNLLCFNRNQFIKSDFPLSLYNKLAIPSCRMCQLQYHPLMAANIIMRCFPNLLVTKYDLPSQERRYLLHRLQNSHITPQCSCQL